MKVSDLSSAKVLDAIDKISNMKNATIITWPQFEKLIGVSIRPATTDTSSIEWMGYVANRNMMRVMINGLSIEEGKRAAFELRPIYINGDYKLQKLSGAALFDSYLNHHKMKVQRAPRNMVDKLAEIEQKVALPRNARNKLLNTITIGKILMNASVKMIDVVLNDPDIALPNYSKTELRKLTLVAADDANRGTTYKEVG